MCILHKKSAEFLQGNLAVRAVDYGYGVFTAVVKLIPLSFRTGKEDVFQGYTVIKGGEVDGFDGCGDADGFQIRTTVESFFAYVQHTVGNFDAAQSVAVVECPTFHIAQCFGKFDGRQAVAVFKTAFTEVGDGEFANGFGNCQFVRSGIKHFVKVQITIFICEGTVVRTGNCRCYRFGKQEKQSKTDNAHYSQNKSGNPESTFSDRTDFTDRRLCIRLFRKDGPVFDIYNLSAAGRTKLMLRHDRLSAIHTKHTSHLSIRKFTQSYHTDKGFATFFSCGTESAVL